MSVISSGLTIRQCRDRLLYLLYGKGRRCTLNQGKAALAAVRRWSGRPLGLSGGLAWCQELLIREELAAELDAEDIEDAERDAAGVCSRRLAVCG